MLGLVSGVRTAEGEVWLHKRSWTYFESLQWDSVDSVNSPVNYFRSLKSSDANWFEDRWDWSLRGEKDMQLDPDPMMVQSINPSDWCLCNIKNLALAAKDTLLSYDLEHIASIYYLLSGNTDLLDPYAFLPIGILHCPESFPDSLVSSSFFIWCCICFPHSVDWQR